MYLWLYCKETPVVTLCVLTQINQIVLVFVASLKQSSVWLESRCLDKLLQEHSFVFDISVLDL